MGAALGPECANCAGHRDTDASRRTSVTPGSSARAGSSSSSQTIQEWLDKSMPDGPLDRVDLDTRWPDLSKFTMIQEPLATHTIALSDSGTVDIDSAVNFGKQVFQIDLPDLGAGSYLYSQAGSDNYIMAISSVETNLPRKLGRHKSLDALVERVYELLRAGAETVEITIGQEMLTSEYDINAILSELESRSVSARSKHARSWIITSFSWMVFLHYKFVPAPDPLKKYIQRLCTKAATKDQLLRQMKGHVVDAAIERFKKFASEDESITVAEQWMHMMVDQAHERTFSIERVGPDQDASRINPLVTPRGGPRHFVSVEVCMGQILDALRAESLNMENWQVLIGWEAVQVTQVIEAMHEAQWHLSNGRQMQYMRYALRAASLAGVGGSGESAVMQTESGASKQGLSKEQKEAIIAAGKTLTDDLIVRFSSGEISRESFEEQFAELCDTMVHMIEQHLLPYVDCPEHRAMCLRQIADYRRYMFVYVPKKRGEEKLISDGYKKAQEQADLLPPRNIASVTTAVNFAMFHAEVRHDAALAAQTCRMQVDKALRWRNPLLDTGLDKAVANPSEVFNWDLLQSNLVAFETRFVVIRITFRLASWQRHKALIQEHGEKYRPMLTGDAVIPGANKYQSEADGPYASAGQAPSTPDDIPGDITEDHWSTCDGLRLFNDKAKRVLEEWGSKAGIQPPWIKNVPMMDTNLPSARLTVSSSRRSNRSTLLTSSRSTQNNSARRNMANAEAKELTEEMTEDLATVMRWLESRPLRRSGQADQGDEGSGGEDEDDGEVLLRHVRWVSHAEFADAALEVRGVTGPPRLTLESASVPFLVGCAVRLSPTALMTVSRGKNQHAWLEELQKELRAWPSDSPNDSEPRTVEVFLRPELEVILDSLNEVTGVMKEQVSCGNSGANVLHSGDVLLAPGGGGPDAFPQYLEELRNNQKFPISLTFQPCLQVKEARWLEEGAYTEHHQRFQGFRKGHSNNLQPGPEFSSFVDMYKEMKAQRERSHSYSSKVPRRIAGLSARRSPVQAASRGCN